MELKDCVGQLLVGGFLGHSLTTGARAALTEGRLGGIILFRRNIESLEQVVALNQAISAAAPQQPWICIDQEGGRVVRVTEALGATPIPPMAAVGATSDADLAASVGEAIATEVGALGFNVNFAPVLDVDTNPENPIIGDRSFSRDPQVVSTMGGALMAGHLIAGVCPCGKHFPGHGDTLLDSHLDLPVIEHDRRRLDRIELVPFRRLIKAGLPMIMTAHISMPALDDSHPATLSRRIMTGLLREELGFDGIIVSDDLEMKAVAERYEVEESMTLGLEAGVDLFLICKEEELWERAYEHTLRKAESDAAFRGLVEAAAHRIVRTKSTILPGGLDGRYVPAANWRATLGHADHRAVMARVTARMN